MYPFPLDRCIRPMSLPARRIHSLVFVRGDARRSFRPPMAWSVFFLTALPVSNEEQRASESRIRRRSISYPISLSRFLRCCSHNECLTAQLHRLPCFTLLFPTPFHLLISYPLTTLPALPSIPSKMPYSTMPRSDGGLVVDHAEDVIETEDASSNEARSKTSEERPHRPRCGLDANIFFDPQSRSQFQPPGFNSAACRVWRICSCFGVRRRLRNPSALRSSSANSSIMGRDANLLLVTVRTWMPICSSRSLRSASRSILSAFAWNESLSYSTATSAARHSKSHFKNEPLGCWLLRAFLTQPFALS